MPVHNFVRLWCILLRNAAVQHPGKFARSCVGNTAAILHQHNMTGGDFLFQLDGKHIPRRQLEHGKALMELLKQPLYQPKSDAEQVVLLTLAAHGVLDEIKTVELRQKTSAFVRQFRTDPSGVMDEIQASGKLSPEQVQTILNAWNAFAGGDAHAIH